MTKPAKGHVRLSMRFATAIEETINVIVYAKFPEIMSIDKARNITVS